METRVGKAKSDAR